MKRLLLLFSTCLFLFAVMAPARAQEEKRVQMKVTYEKDGQTTVTEKEFTVTDMSEIDEVLKEMGLDEPKPNQYIEKEVIINEHKAPFGNEENAFFHFGNAKPSRPMIGFYPDDDYEGNDGVAVEKIVTGSGAEKAGLAAGDRITAINGNSISGMADLRKEMGKYKVDEKISLSVIREGSPMKLPVVLQAPKDVKMPGDKLLHMEKMEKAASKAQLGVILMETNIIEKNGDKAETGIRPESDAPGILIQKVIENSAAGEAGMQGGDRLVKAGGKTLHSYAELKEIMKDKNPGDALEISWTREGKTFDATVTLKAPEESAFMMDQLEDLDINMDLEGLENLKQLEKLKDIDWESLKGLESLRDLEKLRDIDWENLEGWEEGDLDKLNMMGNRFIIIEDDAEEGPEKPFLGVYIENVTAEKGLSVEQGVLLTEVMEGGAAEAAGLQKGDVLIKMDGQSLNAMDDLFAAMKEKKPGDIISLTYLRDGKTNSSKATLGKKENSGKKFVIKELEEGDEGDGYIFEWNGDQLNKEDLHKHFKQKSEEGHSHYSFQDKDQRHHTFKFPNWSYATETKPFLGVGIENTDHEEAVAFGLKGGVTVTEIYENSAAEEAGIREGDIIYRIDKAETPSIDELVEAIKSHAPGDKVKVFLMRDGGKKKVKATLKEKEVKIRKPFSGENEPLRWFGEKGADIQVNVIVREFDEKEEGNTGWLRDMKSPSLEAVSFNFYPNPNKGRFTLDFTLQEEGPADIRIYTNQGQLVYEESISDFSGSYSGEIDISDNSPGVYFLQLSQNGKGMAKKIVVQD